MNTSHINKETNNDTAIFTSQAKEQSVTVTRVSPNKDGFPDPSETEAKFHQVCYNLKRPVRLVLKKDIEWNKRDPLHFWQSLAFILKSKEDTFIAVSCFVNKQGENKLYIASNDSMNECQQREITEIINMFLDLKPMNEIAAKLLPRHLFYIIKQLNKITMTQLKEYTGEWEKPIKTLLVKHASEQDLSFDEIRALMNLIPDHRKVLKSIKRQNWTRFLGIN